VPPDLAPGKSRADGCWHEYPRQHSASRTDRSAQKSIGGCKTDILCGSGGQLFIGNTSRFVRSTLCCPAPATQQRAVSRLHKGKRHVHSSSLRHRHHNRCRDCPHRSTRGSPSPSRTLRRPPRDTRPATRHPEQLTLPHDGRQAHHARQCREPDRRLCTRPVPCGATSYPRRPNPSPPRRPMTVGNVRSREPPRVSCMTPGAPQSDSTKPPSSTRAREGMPGCLKNAARLGWNPHTGTSPASRTRTRDATRGDHGEEATSRSTPSTGLLTRKGSRTAVAQLFRGFGRAGAQVRAKPTFHAGALCSHWALGSPRAGDVAPSCQAQMHTRLPARSLSIQCAGPGDARPPLPAAPPHRAT
jgi:hypothetical protein